MKNIFYFFFSNIWAKKIIVTSYILIRILYYWRCRWAASSLMECFLFWPMEGAVIINSECHVLLISFILSYILITFLLEIFVMQKRDLSHSTLLFRILFVFVIYNFDHVHQELYLWSKYFYIIYFLIHIIYILYLLSVRQCCCHLWNVLQLIC
jgi:hypothetical protein